MRHRTRQQGFLFVFDDVPATPTEWERFLAELGMDEAEAMRVSRQRLDGWQRIQRWAAAHCRRVYVPEDLLAELGVELHEYDFPVTGLPG